MKNWWPFNAGGLCGWISLLSFCCSHILWSVLIWVNGVCSDNSQAFQYSYSYFFCRNQSMRAINQTLVIIVVGIITRRKHSQLTNAITHFHTHSFTSFKHNSQYLRWTMILNSISAPSTKCWPAGINGLTSANPQAFLNLPVPPVTDRCDMALPIL